MQPYVLLVNGDWRSSQYLKRGNLDGSLTLCVNNCIVIRWNLLFQWWSKVRMLPTIFSFSFSLVATELLKTVLSCLYSLLWHSWNVKLVDFVVLDCLNPRTFFYFFLIFFWLITWVNTCNNTPGITASSRGGGAEGGWGWIESMLLGGIMDLF